MILIKLLIRTKYLSYRENTENISKYVYIYIYIMHDIFPNAKNPCRENFYSAKREQFICAENPCFTVTHWSRTLFCPTSPWAALFWPVSDIL